MKLPLFFLFFYGCLFQEEAPTSFAITMLFIEQAVVALTRIEALSFAYIHNQRKKKKMRELMFPHCCMVRNITMARSFAPTPTFLGNKYTQKKGVGAMMGNELILCLPTPTTKEKNGEPKLPHSCTVKNTAMIMPMPHLL